MTLDYGLARAAIKRALAARGWNAVDLAREAGKDEGTVLDFLNGVRTPQIKTRGKIETALGWPGGSIDDIAAGGEVPVTTEEPAQTPALSVVPAIVEPPVDEEENEVLAAILRDPYLDDDSRQHFLNQYELLRKKSVAERTLAELGEERLRYVARTRGGRPKPKVGEEKQRELEDVVRRTMADPEGEEEVPPK